MSVLRHTLRRVFITTCLLTRTTEPAAHRLGAGFFLPALFVLRYSSMGGLDPQHFAQQLHGIKSFREDRWCNYWNAIAQQHLQAAEPFVPGLTAHILAVGAPAQAPQWGQPRTDTDTSDGVNGAPMQTALAALGPQIATLLNLRSSERDPALAIETAQALDALRHLIQAITYYQVSAFPGGTPERMRAYHRSRAIFHQVTRIVAPILGMRIERRQIEVAGETVEGYLVTPPGTQACPLAIISNGLEGTLQELAIPLFKYHDSGLAVFFMEMPGTYAYRQRMSLDSEAIYHGVIDNLAQHPRVDAERLAFVGVSFGAYWAARLAATSPRLRCVVACGAPTHHSFQIGNTIGIPEIIVTALRQTTGARNLHDLLLKLQALSLRDLYARIKVPLLVINGDHDTLLSTQDSIDLAQHADRGEIRLYPDDDHCAMGHYNEWLDLSQTWILRQLQ